MEGETAFLCKTCGVQYAPSKEPPPSCKVCVDDRQYVPPQGQVWTTQAELGRSHRNCWQLLEPGLYGISTEPKLAIGQRALLIKTPEGNVLWDCLSLLDAATAEIVKLLGGVKAIAISHPHYYGNCVEWSKEFGDAPIYIHARDEQWLGWPHDNVRLWEGETQDLGGGVTLLQLGGHFAGAQVLHWAAGAGGQGALLTGDILQVGMDRETVSVMRSYPNFIPLSEAHVLRIAKRLGAWTFSRLYGAFWSSVIRDGAKRKVDFSFERYIHYLRSDDFNA